MYNVLKNVNINLNSKLKSCLITSIRNGHRIRGKPPGRARSLEQRLSELKYKDPALHFRVDIGLPHASYSRSDQVRERLEVVNANRKSGELERKSRNRELLIDLENVKQEWLKTSGQYQIKEIADHYGIFEHLFGDAYFVPRVHLHINYNIEDSLLPVYYGNVIKPAQASKTPNVAYESDSKSMWTLVLTNPDGNFTDQNSEYVHWFVGNIPGNDLTKGETIIEYLQPFPPKGTGYHRHVFLLYRQEGRVDYSTFKKEGPCVQLSERTFKTLNFYRPLQDKITPAGLAFFQSDWDKSLIDFYHSTLGMKHPVFEYDFPKPYVKPQSWFPLRQPFNSYMDKYRDEKQINKEFLIRKLKNVHPFKSTPPPLPYPNAVYFEETLPSWLKVQKQKARLKIGRINDIEVDYMK